MYLYIKIKNDIKLNKKIFVGKLKRWIKLLKNVLKLLWYNIINDGICNILGGNRFLR